MKPSRMTLLRAVLRHMQAYPDGRGLHEADASKDLGAIDALDLYYLQDAGLLYRNNSYLKLSAAGMDAAETDNI